jgi:hypothetical protein
MIAIQTIELTPIDAELFIQFRKHQDQFEVLLREGVFDSYVGSKTVHKDGDRIRLIETTFIKRY